MNICDLHTTHDRRTVQTPLGEFVIFDFEKYMGYRGYCTGQDDVSLTLATGAPWSIEIVKCIENILSAAQNGKLFVDIGCHIGWFSRLAEQHGCRVMGFDGDAENLELSKINVPGGDFHLMWFDKNTEPLRDAMDIEIIKMDIEGAEQWAVKYFEKSFELGTIKNAIIEISPVFNDSYPALVERIKNYGYRVMRVDGTAWNGIFDFNQTDFWFKKI